MSGRENPAVALDLVSAEQLGAQRRLLDGRPDGAGKRAQSRSQPGEVAHCELAPRHQFCLQEVAIPNTLWQGMDATIANSRTSGKRALTGYRRHPKGSVRWRTQGACDGCAAALQLPRTQASPVCASAQTARERTRTVCRIHAARALKAHWQGSNGARKEGPPSYASPARGENSGATGHTDYRHELPASGAAPQ